MVVNCFPPPKKGPAYFPGVDAIGAKSRVNQRRPGLGTSCSCWLNWVDLPFSRAQNIAATPRPGILGDAPDPGFDRVIEIPIPDDDSRKAILKVHLHR
ncbi:MAG: hypothetical protein CM15mP78_10110 [Candidatus Poseidoniales archaeon]|nr:MAG: hypothetical protein CM15mP78_10110 [Candidatus Poseidoniales archaeon]